MFAPPNALAKEVKFTGLVLTYMPFMSNLQNHVLPLSPQEARDNMKAKVVVEAAFRPSPLFHDSELMCNKSVE